MPGVKFVFSSPYRGGTKTWSTKVYVNGPDWASQAQFNAYVDAVWGDWITRIATTTTFVEAVAYDAGSFLPVFTYAKNAAGTYSLSGLQLAPLEACILLRYTTTARTSKNHPIYLWNYIHNVPTNGATSPDVPASGFKSGWDTRAAALVTGYSDGTQVRKRAGPRGAIAQAGACETYLHMHEFPR